MVGAAAALGGVTRMTVSLVVIMFEVNRYSMTTKYDSYNMSHII